MQKKEEVALCFTQNVSLQSALYKAPVSHICVAVKSNFDNFDEFLPYGNNLKQATDKFEMRKPLSLSGQWYGISKCRL